MYRSRLTEIEHTIRIKWPGSDIAICCRGDRTTKLCYGPLKRILFATSGFEANISADMTNTISLKHACVRFICFVIVLCVTDVLAQSHETIRLNENAFAFAEQLVREGHCIADGKGAWSVHRPSADEENEFIRLHGFPEYAKWHLGIDDRYPVNTKRRYKFPYGDFKNVHRSGLLAARARARQYGYTEIENAAAKLEQAIKNQPPINSAKPMKMHR